MRNSTSNHRRWRRATRHDGIAMFRNLEEALAYVFAHGLHKDLISNCRYGYIIRPLGSIDHA